MVEGSLPFLKSYTGRYAIMSWFQDAVFYHLFPLGCLGAPERNSFEGPAANRLSELMVWIKYLEDLGVNALLLGPVFESSAHGYDIADYFRVDRRLGDDATLAAVSRELHRRGILRGARRRVPSHRQGLLGVSRRSRKRTRVGVLRLVSPRLHAPQSVRRAVPLQGMGRELRPGKTRPQKSRGSEASFQRSLIMDSNGSRSTACDSTPPTHSTSIFSAHSLCIAARYDLISG